MIVVVKKDHERFEALVRRFNREVQQSGNASIIKKKRYFAEEPSRDKRRVAAIHKAARKAIKRGY